MRKLLFFLSLFCITLTNVNAQSKVDADKVKQELKQNFDESSRRMKLNEKQKKQYWTIVNKYFGKLTTVQESSAGAMQKINSVMELLDQRAAEVKPILTESQYKMYLQIQEERIQKVKEKMKG